MAYQPKRVSIMSEDGTYELQGIDCYSDEDVEDAKRFFKVTESKDSIVRLATEC